MKAPGGQIEDQTAIHLGVEGKVEVIESLVGVAETGLFVPEFQKAVTTPGEFVGMERFNPDKSLTRSRRIST